MNSDDGRGRRPEAGALDPNTEYYAKGAEARNAAWRRGSGKRGQKTERGNTYFERNEASRYLDELSGVVECAAYVDRSVREAIQRALAAGCDVTALARRLGVHRATIYRRYLTTGSEEVKDPIEEGSLTGELACNESEAKYGE